MTSNQSQDSKEERLREIDQAIYLAEEALECDKGKRIKILFAVYSIFVLGLFFNNSFINSIGSFFCALLLSAVFGAVATFLPIMLLSAVTGLFTNIHQYEDRISLLKRERYLLDHVPDPDDDRQ